METVYKLVKRVDDKLVSIKATGKAQVEYKIGEWVEAPEWLNKQEYQLCVFKDKKNAQRVMRIWEKDSILFECEAENVHYTTEPYLSIYYLDRGEIQTYGGSQWPTLAQIMAQRVKLIKEIS